MFTTLMFSPESEKDTILKSKSSDRGVNGHTKVLAPPTSEFDMLVTKLKSKESEAIKAIRGPSIMVVTGGNRITKADGKEAEVKEGYVFFIGNNTEIELKAEDGLETGSWVWESLDNQFPFLSLDLSCLLL